VPRNLLRNIDESEIHGKSLLRNLEVYETQIAYIHQDINSQIASSLSKVRIQETVRRRHTFTAAMVEKIKTNLLIVRMENLGTIPYLKFTDDQRLDPVACRLHADHQKLDAEPYRKKPWFSEKDPKDVEELQTQIEIQRAMDNEDFQEPNYPKACEFLGLNPLWPTVKSLRLVDSNGNPGCLLPHQVGTCFRIPKPL